MVRWLLGSAWPYINYVPHLGTIIGSVLSGDVVARHLRLKGENVLYVSGSDEHGTPIEVEAVRLGISPKKLTDENHARVKNLFDKWHISFDNYTRTESPVHIDFVKEFYMKIYRNGYVFSKEEDILYCPNCKRFLPDRFIQGTCPKCNYLEAYGDQCPTCGTTLDPKELVNPRCTICSSTPEIRATKHWYFDLPLFADELERYVKNNPRLPENARNFSLKLIREGLKPRSLTRDISWGISAPFPGAQSKTIYVWMEAVLGYISATIEYFRLKGEEERWRDYWFNGARVVFFIGKDNIPFHTIILPALLMASEEDYELPWTISSTEFLMFEGKKFSKSKRIGIWIDEALEISPADYWRYTLLSIRPEIRDTNFTWETFLEKVNSELNDTIGNLIHRALTFLCRYFNCQVPKPSIFDDYDRKILEDIKTAKDEFDKFLCQMRIQQAVQIVTELARKTNKYFNDKEPWKTVNNRKDEAASTLYISLQVVAALSIMLEPLIPETAKTIRKTLNLKLLETLKGVPEGLKVRKPQPLFRKVSLGEIDRKLKGEVEMGQATPEDVLKLGLKVAKVIGVEEVPKARKLYKLKLDFGGGIIKHTVAGLKEQYKSEELLGKLVVVASNMKPTRLMGIESEVMLLAAVEEGKVSLIVPEKPVKLGSEIY